MLVVDKDEQFALAHDSVIEIQTRKFKLIGAVGQSEFIKPPVIQFTIVFKFQGAYRVGNALDVIREAVCEVIQWIDAPFGTLTIVWCVLDPVQQRIPHFHVGRCHIDTSA